MESPFVRRQIWAHPSPTTTSLPHTCSPFRLRSGGVLNLGRNNIVTLTNDAVFQPGCPSVDVPQPVDPLQADADFSILDRREPFYSSTGPQIYAISAVTIVSYMLVIILFITPRTFYIGGPGGGVSILGRRGAVGLSCGSNTVIGIGSRPWLQKLAALTLAISLTIVTADTFKWAERQYNDGYQDAGELSGKVINGLEIRIVRLISESFLLLAQSQTLIRLFQRHKEKLMIKWTAFVLITLEIIFSILNHFVNEGTGHHPRAFASSMPALNYLFALALNICYAAFVIIYALRKRRFAFFHPQMHSMPLMALLSITAVLIPAIFFILDLLKPDVSGWGSYVCWVGACAASVVVWEWVERIEALEREEKKDGVLGREIFDGDEMLESQPPKGDWPNEPRKNWRERRRGGSFGNGWDGGWSGMTRVAKRIGRFKDPRSLPMKEMGDGSEQSSVQDTVVANAQCSNIAPHDQHQTPSPPVGSPVSRAHTTSAASTVYMVRYNAVTEPTPPIPGVVNKRVQSQELTRSRQPERPGIWGSGVTTIPGTMSRLSRITLPFRRQPQSPPAEVAAAMAGQQAQPLGHDSVGPRSIFERFRVKGHQHPIEIPTAVIVVPAPPRRKPSFSSDVRTQTDQWKESEPGDEFGDEGQDRQPAAVRHALRMSNPTTPVAEHGRAFPTFSITGQRLGDSPPLTVDTQERQAGPMSSLEEQHNFWPTDHDR
ncbi:MAG: hypothetical protein Q9163_003338 [Psora crenata]